MRRTLRSLGEGGWKGFGEFRKIPRSFAPRSFIISPPIRTRLLYDSAKRLTDPRASQSDDFVTIRRSDSDSRIGRFGDFVGQLSVDSARHPSMASIV